jgi:methylenetetrahydrofolate dehydrogenase (NADP+) / methenyltetrahydrofolate cyclohydrolase
MIVDGRKIAWDIIEELKEQVTALDKNLSLGIILMEPDFATEKFVAIKRKTAEKAGVALIERRLSPAADTEEIIRALSELSDATDGIIVQLPLASHIDTDKVLAAVPGARDVDGIGKDPLVYSPVVEAMREILSRGNISPKGKRALVVGQGKLVGKPAAVWLEREGAEVSIFADAGSFAAAPLIEADIIVLGAGSPQLLKPEMIKEGVVILDAGTSEAGGKLAGDADAACAARASLFTPVPGGIGPIAVAMIFKNLLALSRATQHSIP